jgi:hypothetical protein
VERLEFYLRESPTSGLRNRCSQGAQINDSDWARHSPQRSLTELVDLDNVADGCG